MIWRRTVCLIIDAARYFWNVGTVLPDYTASRPKDGTLECKSLNYHRYSVPFIVSLRMAVVTECHGGCRLSVWYRLRAREDNKRKNLYIDLPLDDDIQVEVSSTVLPEGQESQDIAGMGPRPPARLQGSSFVPLLQWRAHKISFKIKMSHVDIRIRL